MRVLFNTACLFKGGGLTVAASFIIQALSDKSGIQWSFAISRSIADELKKLKIDIPSDTTVFEVSPAKNRKARRQLKSLEDNIRPDAIFTLFGPAYVRFRSPHLMGFAIPWVTNPSWAAYRISKLPLEPIKHALLYLYHGHWTRYADAWVVQTETARSGLHKRLGLPLESIDVIPNTCDEHYMHSQAIQPYPESGTKIRLLCFAAAHPHKNLIMVPRVAQQLALLAPSLDFEFLLTLPPEISYTKRVLSLTASLGVSHRVSNIGPVPLVDGPALYQGCHICFLPTVLEVFSATYPESMAMGVPIITTDLGFARDVCRDAALYYDHRDPRAAAECVQRLLGDRELWESLITRGKQVLDTLPNAEQRYQQYVASIKKLLKNKIQ